MADKKKGSGDKKAKKSEPEKSAKAEASKKAEAAEKEEATEKEAAPAKGEVVHHNATAAGNPLATAKDHEPNQPVVEKGGRPVSVEYGPPAGHVHGVNYRE